MNLRIKKIVVMCFIIASTTIFPGCKKEPCDAIICLNNGYCANGDCLCPDGYIGSDCSQQRTPTKIKVTKIDVLKFPPTNGGAGWDLLSGPEIFPVIKKGATTIWESKVVFENPSPSKIYQYIVSPPAELTSPLDEYTISLYDDDIDGDDYMGGIIFTPYWNNNKFPATLDLDAGGNVAFRIYLTYVW